MSIALPFDNSYARLPDRFHVRQAPVPVADPALIAVNDALARDLGLDPAALRTEAAVAAFAGNTPPDGAEPLAQAYAGHQFGNWVPQLGDGRAILLGEVVAPDGRRVDIQLKGAGQTPFSRRGDGRAAIGPVIREYIVSEAMAALAVPTTRALAAVTTGEVVWRETGLPGAVLTRVAASHIRVGTFQYFAAREDAEALDLLTRHVIARHYPGAEDPLALLDAVTERQARLIARWMSLGFIHGVMNTDNMAVSGETIDYGPCAFMDGYHPRKVFSSIDQFGRYAYGNQPRVAVWNLAQFASCLLPLMGAEGPAVEAATESINRFPAIYEEEWLRLFRAKVGISWPEEDDYALIAALLEVMAQQNADFTRVFRGLATGMAAAEFTDTAPFAAWEDRWRARIAEEPAPEAVMRKVNPAYIPRNHRVEEAIRAATEGDYAPFHRLNKVLAQPFEEREADAAFALAPLPEEEVRRTFCGT
ncbi:protein adenylyltransferase SelO [Albidovulum sediminicola]|uniref:Protein nucleotidyltransferase YdiU n=1 Tax=Albidovulum sediminicola TaxID=2984331 RepID=A0ABT2Z0J1_9RHOB|nr:YdiU family protein [Defluviimonas sp. WL0075]MCV2864660.1 YdiU family protein [Defluviimonas sp. WL0075]